MMSAQTSQHRITSVTNDGLVFDVADSGPVDGPVIVLLHGFPQKASVWNDVTEILNAHGYRTIAPDQRGYSEGARPHGVMAYRMPALVSDVVALVNAIDRGAVHLVGHDWGSAVAWSVAGAHPGHVRTLTAVSVPHNAAFLQAMISSDQMLRSYYMFLFQVPGLMERLARHTPSVIHTLLGKAGMDRQQIRQFQTDIVDAGALTATLNWYRAMVLMKPADIFRKVSVPTLHVWGEQDAALSRRGAELTERHVSGPYQLRVMPGVGHWIPEQSPGALAQLVMEQVER